VLVVIAIIIALVCGVVAAVGGFGWASDGVNEDWPGYLGTSLVAFYVAVLLK